MKSKNTDVVFTAIFGNYDQISLINPDWDCDFICFTDNPGMSSNGWQIRVVQLNGETPASLNRRYKMFPNIYLAEYERSLYIDGNVRLLSNPQLLFDKYLSKSILAIPKHLDRNCAYEEAAYCAKVNLGASESIGRQMEKYKREGFPQNFGLSENSIILRKHHDERVILLMNAWWEEYSHGVKRDQLSLQYVMWKNNFKMTSMSENPRGKNKFFRTVLHGKFHGLSLIKRFILYIGCNKHQNFLFKFLDMMINFVRQLRVKFFLKKV